MRIALLERVNPFLKAIIVLLGCVLLIVCSSPALNAAMLAVCVLCLIFFSRCSWRALAGIVLPSLLLAAALCSTALAFGSSSAQGGFNDLSSLSSALQLATRILGLVGLGIFFALSTDGDELATSLMIQAHVKPKFAYSVLAAYHLLPSIAREWERARLAYQVRGQKVGVLSIGPLFNALVNCVRWSETLAMAMESKGFDGDAARTYTHPARIRGGDILFCVLALAVMAAGAVCTTILF